MRLFNDPGRSPSVYRSFRLLSPLPVCVHFFATIYVLDLYVMPGTEFAEYLKVFLPWQDLDRGRDIAHAGRNVVRRDLEQAFNVESPSLAEVLFLRLVRQGDAEQVAGPHTLIPWRGFGALHGKGQNTYCGG